jgi:hypothetical protein
MYQEQKMLQNCCQCYLTQWPILGTLSNDFKRPRVSTKQTAWEIVDDQFKFIFAYANFNLTAQLRLIHISISMFIWSMEWCSSSVFCHVSLLLFTDELPCSCCYGHVSCLFVFICTRSSFLLTCVSCLFVFICTRSFLLTCQLYTICLLVSMYSAPRCFTTLHTGNFDKSA